MIREIIKKKKISLKKKPPYKSFSNSLGDDLIQPTKIYVKQILPLIKNNSISGISHITGGGIFENLERIIPEKMQAIVDFKNYNIPEKFLWLKNIGKIKKRNVKNI